MFQKFLVSDAVKISILFIVWRLILFGFGFVALLLMPKVVAGELVFSSTNFWQSWANWDGGHFLGIAEHGFRLTQQYAFFPLYPGLIAVLAKIFAGNFLLAGLLVSNFSALLAVIFLYKLAKLDWGRDFSLRIVSFFLFFPTAFFLGAAYSESFFIFASLASIYYLRVGNFTAFPIFAILATLTKPYGVLIIFPLTVEYFLLKKSKFKFEPRLILFLTPIAAFALYLFYLKSVTGDALIFFKVQAEWLRTPANPIITFWNYYKSFFTTSLNLFYGIHLIEFLSAVLTLAILVTGWVKLRLSYFVYLLSFSIVFISSGTLTSFPRFLLILWPSFFVLAAWGENFLFDFVYKTASLTLLGLLTSLFLSGFFVS